MFVAYTASSVSKTDSTKQIHGNVIIDATPTVDSNHIQYSVVAFQFVMDALQFSGSGPTAGNLMIARMPNGNIGEIGSTWTLGAWHAAGDGLGFFTVDNTKYGVEPLPWERLAPRILLGCDGDVNGGPFQPGGNILLYWNPLFLIPHP
jgi:hypothetical protein